MTNKKVYHVWIEATSYVVVESKEEAKNVKERWEDSGFSVEIIECWEAID